MVTVAPGTAEPCPSLTTPLMIARSDRCARREVLTQRLRVSEAATHQTARRKLDIVSLPKVGQRVPMGARTLVDGSHVCEGVQKRSTSRDGQTSADGKS